MFVLDTGRFARGNNFTITINITRINLYSHKTSSLIYEVHVKHNHAYTNTSNHKNRQGSKSTCIEIRKKFCMLFKKSLI